MINQEIIKDEIKDMKNFNSLDEFILKGFELNLSLNINLLIKDDNTIKIRTTTFDGKVSIEIENEIEGDSIVDFFNKHNIDFKAGLAHDWCSERFDYINENKRLGKIKVQSVPLYPSGMEIFLATLRLD